MNDMSPIGIGHNGGPDLLDEAIASDPEALELAEGLLCGMTVQDESQMAAVDAVAARLKAIVKAVEAAKEQEYRPHKAAADAVIAKYKPTLTDLDRQVKGCARMVNDFKVRIAAERAEAERQARLEAEAAARAAHEARMRADETDIEAQREADAATARAEAAHRAARQASRDSHTPGLRTFQVTEVLDATGYARWLWENDRAWLLETMKSRATACRHHVPGIVETRHEKRAI